MPHDFPFQFGFNLPAGFFFFFILLQIRFDFGKKMEIGDQVDQKTSINFQRLGIFNRDDRLCHHTDTRLYSEARRGMPGEGSSTPNSYYTTEKKTFTRCNAWASFHHL